MLSFVYSNRNPENKHFAFVTENASVDSVDGEVVYRIPYGRGLYGFRSEKARNGFMSRINRASVDKIAYPIELQVL